MGNCKSSGEKGSGQQRVGTGQDRNNVRSDPPVGRRVTVSPASVGASRAMSGVPITRSHRPSLLASIASTGSRSASVLLMSPRNRSGGGSGLRRWNSSGALLPLDGSRHNVSPSMRRVRVRNTAYERRNAVPIQHLRGDSTDIGGASRQSSSFISVGSPSKSVLGEKGTQSQSVDSSDPSSATPFADSNTNLLPESFVQLHEGESHAYFTETVRVTTAVTARTDTYGNPAINEYGIIRPLGMGQCSEVLLVMNRYNEPFALKTVSVAHGDEDAALEEVEAMRAVRHPGIATLYEVIVDTGDVIHLVVEYLPRGHLFSLDEESATGNTSEGCFSITAIKNTARVLVAAVRYLHANGISHRDIKHDNILVSEEGVPKLCDFGRAFYDDRGLRVNGAARRDDVELRGQLLGEGRKKTSSDDASHHSNENDTPNGSAALYTDSFSMATRDVLQMNGALAYRPPTPRHSAQLGDMWALGVVFYAMTYGKLPFYSSDASSLQDLIQQNNPGYPANRIEVLRASPGKNIGSESEPESFSLMLSSTGSASHLDFLSCEKLSNSEKNSRSSVGAAPEGDDPREYQLLVSFLKGLLRSSETERMTAEDAVRHPFLGNGF